MVFPSRLYRVLSIKSEREIDGCLAGLLQAAQDEKEGAGLTFADAGLEGIDLAAVANLEAVGEEAEASAEEVEDFLALGAGEVAGDLAHAVGVRFLAIRFLEGKGGFLVVEV